SPRYAVCPLGAPLDEKPDDGLVLEGPGGVKRRAAVASLQALHRLLPDEQREASRVNEYNPGSEVADAHSSLPLHHAASVCLSRIRPDPNGDAARRRHGPLGWGDPRRHGRADERRPEPALEPGDERGRRVRLSADPARALPPHSDAERLQEVRAKR